MSTPHASDTFARGLCSPLPVPAADPSPHSAAGLGAARPEPVAATPPPEPFWLGPQQVRRPGLGRLAGSAPRAELKRGTEYFLLPVKSILNHCDSDRVPFEWTVNPYRGCEFGCRYCYARYTHEFMDLGGGEFASKIFIKQNAGFIFARDLASHDASKHIAIGTATDPYQPAERGHGNTRSILEKIAAREGLSLSITTKSNLILRDLGLLTHISKNSSLSINISVTTLRTRLARLLEPRAPRPDLRLAAVRALRDAGIRAGVFALPVLPGLTDRPEDLDALARAARDAGALWLGGGALFLMPSAYKEFLPFLEEKFPKLVKGYRKWYARNAYAPEDYRRKLSALFASLREKYSLASRPLPDAVRLPVPDLQSQFPFAAPPAAR